MSSTIQHGSEHTVQFYESDTSLVDMLSALITGSLQAGKRVIIVATASRRGDLEKSLIARNIDVRAARGRNQYSDMDAAQVLCRILVDAKPDAARFASVMGGLIKDTPAEYSGVWAFGEMVAMLWGQRMYDASLRLEALWNGIAFNYGCSLYSAYPSAESAGHGKGPHFRPTGLPYPHFIPAESSELTSSMHRMREHMRSRREQQERALVDDERCLSL